MRGVYSPLSPDEIEDLRRRMPVGSELEIRLFYRVQAHDGILRRLYNAVLGTPLDGSELTAAMRETERALGLSAGHPDITP